MVNVVKALGLAPRKGRALTCKIYGSEVCYIVIVKNELDLNVIEGKRVLVRICILIAVYCHVGIACEYAVCCTFKILAENNLFECRAIVERVALDCLYVV